MRIVMGQDICTPWLDIVLVCIFKLGCGGHRHFLRHLSRPLTPEFFFFCCFPHMQRDPPIQTRQDRETQG